MERKFDLEERLIDFAAGIIDISEALPKTFAGNHLGSQLLRSGTSPALHYGEAQAAESPADFVHKMKSSVDSSFVQTLTKCSLGILLLLRNVDIVKIGIGGLFRIC